MMAPTHALFGASCYLAAYPLEADQVCTSMVFALIADVDLKNSWAGQFGGPVGWMARVFTGGHRKRSHQWWSPLVLAIPAYFLVSHDFAFASLVGYYSHLLGDKIYDTDGWLEHVIRWALWPIMFVCIVYRMVN